MKEFKGTLNDKGLTSYNQSLFDNMSYFSDLVWVIDLKQEMVEILYDTIEENTVGMKYKLEELRSRISKRYPGTNKKIVERFSVEYLKNLKKNAIFNNPTFVNGGKRYKLRYIMTPELDEKGETIRVYVTGINVEDFLVTRKAHAEIYKTASMILSHSKDFKQGVNDVLSFIGNILNVSRVYIFETDPNDKNICHNTFEWCASGITPQRDQLQDISYEKYGYFDLFSESQLFCCDDREHANEEMRNELERQDIRAMINYAFYDNDQLVGFIGFDDCKKTRPDWTIESDEVEILTYVSDLLSAHLVKERILLHAIESKNSEKKLRQKEQENKILLGHFVEAYTSAYTVNLKERTFEIIHMAHEFQKVFTMNGNMDDMKAFVEKHVHPNDREMMRKMIDPDYIRGRMVNESEITFTMREIYEGVEKTMHVIILRSVDADNVSIGFLDVTAEIQKEKEINDKLETAAKARRNFLSSMSHDIRTPMNAILGMVDIALKHSDDKEKMIDSLNKIRTSGNYLLLLVNDILDISAIESGKTELRPTVHSVKDKAKFINNTMQGILNGKNLNFEFKQNDILYPWIVVDEVRLNQITNNLLSNAVKYTPEGGTVTLENRQEKDENGQAWNIISVSDTGIGMSEEFMENMWDAFTRATDTRINTIQGAGLGLAIVKNLVEMMGGTIKAESKLNEGSTFTVRLPIIPARPNEIPEKEDVVLDNSHCEKVLVAEDNDLNWEVAYELLKLNGIECVRAENGKIALELFISSEPGTFDAILMDMQMPVMSGLEATKEIRKSNHPEAKNIPIFAMTANAFAEDVDQCLAAGMNGHLAKPIEIEKVLKALSEATKQ